jgi:hypothetical protein
MRKGEAKYVRLLLDKFSSDTISPCINIGSSTLEFRTQRQPHIHRELFQPLEEKGVEVFHIDIKEDVGVDIVGDIMGGETFEHIRSKNPKLMLCCNLLEHVSHREEFARQLIALMPKGGLLFVTVPSSYPLHFDPIDTYFRPDPDELSALFRELDIVSSETVADTTYLDDLLEKYGPIGTTKFILKSFVKFFFFWRGRRFYEKHYHRFLWLFRVYRVTIMVGRVP